MSGGTPREMRAVALERFGGVEVLGVQRVLVPAPGPGEVLVEIDVAGVGEWDTFEREGGYAEMLGLRPAFPYVLGSEGAGRVVALGEGVTGVEVGQRVHAVGFLNPKGGFYAEYAVADAGLVAPIPEGLSMAQAAVLGGVGLTALRGLEDVLELQAGEAVMIFGASGGIGHVAVQLAQRRGARVLAVTSGDDGVSLVERLGADVTVDGRRDDVLLAAQRFAPNGLDAALLTAGGEVVDRALAAMREGGRVAYPNGVRPEPKARTGVRVSGYNGDPDAEILERLHRRIVGGSFDVHVARTFVLEDVGDAHEALGRHYIGKIALQVR